MRAAAAVAALAEMVVLLRPLEVPGARVEEVSVEMAVMSLFRLTFSVVVEAEVAVWDPSLPLERSPIWGMEVRIKTSDWMEMVMVS
jgi:hypothetical protein